MILPLHFRGGTLGPLLGFLSFLVLGGVWFSPLLSQAASGLVLFLVLSWGHLVLSVVGLRLSEAFSTTHPSKGDEVRYSWTAVNEGAFPTCLVTLVFRKTVPGGLEGLGGETFWFRRHERKSSEAAFGCRYRGVYELGLEAVVFRDLLGTVEWTTVCYPTTFYVAPRVIRSDFSWLNRERAGWARLADDRRGDSDPTAFRTLETFRPGDPVRHLSWASVARGGDPAVKRFETMEDEGLSLYLDLRRSPSAQVGDGLLGREDAVLELALSVAASVLERGASVRVHVWGREPASFFLRDRRIETFLAETVAWSFGPWGDPARLALEHLRSGTAGDTLVLVSASDPDQVLTLAEACQRRGQRLVYLTPGPAESSQGPLIRALVDRGAQVREVSL